MKTATVVLTLGILAGAAPAQSTLSEQWANVELEVKQTRVHWIVEGTNWDRLCMAADGRRFAFRVSARGRECVFTRDYPAPVYNAILKGSPLYSPDGAHVAYAARKGDQWVVVADGKEGAAYDGLGASGLRYSPDGKHLAFVARRGERQLVVLDGEEGLLYDAVAAGGVLFSPDSSHMAYGAKQEDRWFVVLDHRPLEPYPGLVALDFVFSADSRRLACAATRDGKQFIATSDGKEGKPFDTVGQPVLSPDGERLAYVGCRGGAYVLVADGTEGEAFDGIAPPCFSADGKHLAYRALRAGKQYLVVDGARKGPFQGVAPIDGIFCRESGQVAFIADTGGKHICVVGEHEGEPHGKIDPASLVFAAAGTRYAFRAQSAGGNGVESYVVIDGKKGKAYELTGRPIFSPDGQRVAYEAKRGSKMFAVIDGKEAEPYDEAGSIVFSPDSRHVAYMAKRGGKVLVVTDGVAGPACDGVGNPGIQFGPDGTHVVYKAFRGEQWFLVVDGQEHGNYVSFLGDFPAVFEKPDALHIFALARSGHYNIEFLFVDVTIKTKTAVPPQ